MFTTAQKCLPPLRTASSCAFISLQPITMQKRPFKYPEWPDQVCTLCLKCRYSELVTTSCVAVKMQRLLSLVQSSALFISHLGKSGLKNDTDPLMQREKGELPCLVYGTDAEVSLHESKSCWHVKVYHFFFLKATVQVELICMRIKYWQISDLKSFLH